jgi:hypothetical protein
MKFIFALTLLLTTATAATVAFASQNDDFFKKALRQQQAVDVTNMELQNSPKVAMKRASNSVNELGHTLGLNDNPEQPDVYQVAFRVDMNGSIETVTCEMGTLREQAEHNSHQRVVDLRGCNKNFRPNMRDGVAVDNKFVELP